jgi:hypothetical protein
MKDIPSTSFSAVHITKLPRQHPLNNQVILFFKYIPIRSSILLYIYRELCHQSTIVVYQFDQEVILIL